jgi:hypothetical protein
MRRIGLKLSLFPDDTLVGKLRICLDNGSEHEAPVLRLRSVGSPEYLPKTFFDNESQEMFLAYRSHH